MKKFCIILFALLFAQEALRAQDWVQTNGPGGDQISALLFNKKNDMFVLSHYELVRTTDHGSSWKRLYAPQYQFVNIAIAPNDDIYVASTCCVSKSTNNGDSWDSIASASNVLKIGPDGTIYIQGSDRNGYPDFLRSSNEGKSWDTLSLGALEYTGADFIPVIDSNGNLFMGGSGCIYSSTDKGKSWLKDTNGLGGQLQYSSITFGRKGNIYTVGSDKSNYEYAFHSSDGGKTWSPLPFVQGFFIFASSPAGRVLCTGNNILSYSDDDGKTWKDYGGLNQTMIDGIYFICNDKDSGFYLQSYGILFYSNQPGSGIPVSVPLSQISAMVIIPDSNLLTISDNNLSSLSYTEQNWISTIGEVSPKGWLRIDSSKGVLLCAGSFLYRSPDNGIRWVSIAGSFAQTTSMLGCVVHPNGNIFVATRDSGLYRSTDNGFTWSHVLSENRVNAISVDASGNLYASTASGNYISRDNGLNWFLDMSHPQATIFLTSNLYGDLYTCNDTAREMQISLDNGNTWTSFNKGLHATIIHGMITAPDGTVFAYTDSGIFKHSEGDCAWTPFSAGLSTIEILSMTFDKNGRLYAGSAGGGVFKSMQTFNKPPLLTGRLLANDIDFGKINVKETLCKDLTITNIGLAPITLTKNFIVEDPTPFSVASSNIFPILLQPHDSISVSVCFHPQQEAVYASQIDWKTDADISPCTFMKPQSILHGVAVIKSDVKNPSNAINFSLHPNPTSGSFVTLSLSEALPEMVQLSVFDVLGREMYRNKIMQGAKDFEIPVRDLSEGSYYVRMTLNGATESCQFVRIK